MFVDASAIIAILMREGGFETLLHGLDSQKTRSTSPIAFWEAIVDLASKRTIPVALAQQEISAFLVDAGIAIIPINAEIAEISITAFERFGKGRHPARLNMGDCFAYACAKAHKVPLLYVGDDFGQTDVNEGFHI